MANFKKTMMAAAGAAGGAGLDVDEVFSTYLYEGTSSGQSIINNIALADGLGGGTSTQFTGESGNNLRRTSDFSGNSDSTTFTFSAWVFLGRGNTQQFIYSADDGTYAFSVTLDSGNLIQISGWQGITRRLYATQSGTPFVVGVWSHLLISIDLSSTSNRYIYINDTDKTSSFSFSTYSYDPIEFTRANHNIAQQAIYAGTFKGNLAHVYLDYTYRNLSTTSNRRLFINADGGSTSPSTLSALNPIMYLPMTEDYSVGENLGTGGDLTANGPPTIVNNGTEYLSDYGQGGLVWLKSRDNAGGTSNHVLLDTERGANTSTAQLQSDTNGAAVTGYLTSFNSNGFTLASNGGRKYNYSGSDYASWTFRKAPKFFDVVSYTGNGVAGREMPHSLGVAPGMIIVKRLDSTGQWFSWHRAFGDVNTYIYLSSTSGSGSSTGIWGNNLPDSNKFELPSHSINASGATYVAYLFAHNDGDGGFGPDGDADIIKCGSYTGNSSGVEIDLGFEPQWFMCKKTNGGSDWQIFDTMRGMHFATTTQSVRLSPNTSGAETSQLIIGPSPTGVSIPDASDSVNINGGTYIYMAIRRGPLAVPESATDVFDLGTYTGTSANKTLATPFPYDTAMIAVRNASSVKYIVPSRFTNAKFLGTGLSNAELTDTTAAIRDKAFYYGNKLLIGNGSGADWANGSSSNNYVYYGFKRAPGYFDVVAYSGNSTAGRTVSHNLGVAPEMMWLKSRTNTTFWPVYHKDVGYSSVLRLDSSTSPITVGMVTNTSDTDFTLSTSSAVNSSGHNFIAYLFASLPGISKVGSYTGNGSSQTIDCGFSSGARFVMVKRTDSTGNWYVWDTARGIVAGNDPRLAFNGNAAEASDDSVDPENSGFIVNQTGGSNINVSSASYIFYAIA